MPETLGWVSALTEPTCGVATSDWLVPAISGAAGILGALGAQALGRNTQLRVESERSHSAMAVAARGESHEIEGEKRVARGIAAALAHSLEQARLTLDVAQRRKAWWPKHRKLEVEFPRDEQIRLASWIGEPGWGVVIAPLRLLEDADASRAATSRVDRPRQGDFQPTIDAIDFAVGVLRQELVRSLAPGTSDPLAAPNSGDVA
jgi:hypothetical protein